MPLRSEVGALETIPCRIHDAGTWQTAWARSGVAVLPLQHCSCWGVVLERCWGKQQFPRRVSSSDLLSCPVVCSTMVLCYSTGGVGRCFVGLLVALRCMWWDELDCGHNRLSEVVAPHFAGHRVRYETKICPQALRCHADLEHLENDSSQRRPFCKFPIVLATSPLRN